MQAEQQHQSWKVSIHAKATNFKFSLTARNVLPTWKFRRLSVLLRLHRFLVKLKVKSEPSSVSTTPRQKRTLISKFVKVLQKLRIHRVKHRVIAAKKAVNTPYPDLKFLANRLKKFVHEEPLFVGSLLVAILASVSRSISFWKTDHRAILLCLSLLFERYTTGKTSQSSLVLMVATAVCSVLFLLDECTNHSKGYVFEYASKAWNYAAASGSLYAVFQVFRMKGSELGLL